MADSNSDEEYQTRREAHYSQQRSSLRSDPSIRSRAQSSRHLSDYNVPEDYDNLNELAAPPPIPRSRAGSSPHTSWGSGERERRWSNTSRRGSRVSAVRQSGSRRGSRAAEEYNMPNQYENLNEIEAPSPIENPHERSFYYHDTLERERSEPKDARHSRSRRGTDAGPDVTALPSMPDDWYSNGHVVPPSEERPPPSGPPVSRTATEIYTISYLILFSLLGTLARLGLQWLTFYPGAPVVISNLWANFAGTLIMGFLSEDRRLFKDEWGSGVSIPVDPSLSDAEKAAATKASHARSKKTIPLYIGLATGFCGSFTSFSSFMRDVFFALSNNLPTPVNHPYQGTPSPPSTTSTLHRNGGYSFMALLAVLILTLTVCLSALKLGAHIALLLDNLHLTPTLPFFLTRKILDRLVVPIAWLAWLGVIFMSIWPPDRPSGPSSHGTWTNETWRGQAIFALVFAPLGCLTRFYTSLKLNGISPSFPLGTFTVNIFGTAVLGMAFDLQHIRMEGAGTVGGGRVGCQVLQGVMDGFCGCLTTVSTWMAELNGLRRRHAYVYGGCSVGVGLGALVVIMGSVRWTVGWTEVACVT